ncbi:toll/interleukin-1 receptor (TIR) domain-containing protein [Artemisia annua]|uniref:Toll/interleukin-1 receptor (TIR) domain-containing protein n=1 Tax=Artemisia annua TaxID=35608 RepID=A0A2U1QFU8_ARTAN|nr:toll/interleukin-1 receptor (TIR) domain-containing protein [Artemisia annua]
MASTSTSSVQKRFKYDVFISFRGEDTRNTFVGHLYNALKQKGFVTYMDDKKIEKGETIRNQLMKSIEESRFFIIVFSKRYASSSWCLDELVKIMECQSNPEQTAFPVFYDVEPTEVRKQSHAFGEAFKEHENKEAAAAKKWREALKEAANLAGWELKTAANGNESKLIEEVVADISKKLSSVSSSVDRKLVGMEMRIKELLLSLEIGTGDVRMIGIKGMGGGGKTTLATAIFNQISDQFEGSSFVENVREVSKNSGSGLKELQKQILTDIFGDKDITVSSVSGGINKMVQMMPRKKVLVILDDVNDTKQLDALAGASNWFKPGSRIIITTRDEQVLLAHRVNFNHNFIHEVNLLSPEESISLFSRYAFGVENPVEGYEHLSRKVVQYAAGLPLTIKVLGSLLCFQEKPQWNDALERLKTIPLNETMMILELSYNSLEEDCKDIFLDVACLLKGWYKQDAIRALESCGFRAIYGLRVLEQKSLITISKYGVLGMHDHIEEMGKNIVRRSHPKEPHKHSRLWIDEEIESILAEDLDTQAIKCLKLDADGFSYENLLKGLANMRELRFLDLRTTRVSIDDCYYSNRKFDRISLYLPSCLKKKKTQILSNSLRFLRWEGCPFSSLQKAFQANNLVGLEMADSNIVQLCDDGRQKAFLNLRFLKFRDSKLRTLDLGLVQNLEMLHLFECEELEELYMPAECLKLRSLTHLKLRTLHLGSARNLETLRVINCTDMVELQIPDKCPNLVNLDLDLLKLKTLHLGSARNLETLRVINCTDMVELQIPDKCPNLVNLDLDLLKLKTLHLGSARNLETLRVINCTDMVELQIPDKCPNLVNLDLDLLKLKTLHLGSARNLETLRVINCTDMVELQIPDKCPNLVNLDLDLLKLKTLHLRITPNPETPILTDCQELVKHQMPIENVKLLSLDIGNLWLTKLHTGIAPNLESLILRHCCELEEEIHIPSGSLKLKHVDLSFSKLKTLHLGSALNIETLRLDCVDMIKLQMPAEFPKLKNLDLNNLKLTTFHLGITPNLETLRLNKCTDMVKLKIPDECPKLVTLDLSYLRLTNLHLGVTPNLEKLKVNHCTCMVELQIPAECPKLVNLDLNNNAKLRTLNLGLTPHVERLNLENCCDLKEIDAPVGCMKKVVYLNLNGSGRFKSFKFDKEFDSPEVVLLSELHLIAVNWPEFQFSCYYKEDPASSFGNLERLILLGRKDACINLNLFSDIICGLQNLRKLTIERDIPGAPKGLDKLEFLEELRFADIQTLPNNIFRLKHLKSLKIDVSRNWHLKKLPGDIGRLKCLEELSLECREIKTLPGSICKLKHLKSLQIACCDSLEKLPEGIGRLQCLLRLVLEKCELLRGIPNSICKIKSLRYLSLAHCSSVEKLPDNIGLLECLKELDITGTRITRFPHSIFQMNLGVTTSWGIRYQFPKKVEDGVRDDDDVKDVDEHVNGNGDRRMLIMIVMTIILLMTMRMLTVKIRRMLMVMIRRMLMVMMRKMWMWILNMITNI